MNSARRVSNRLESMMDKGGTGFGAGTGSSTARLAHLTPLAGQFMSNQGFTSAEKLLQLGSSSNAKANTSKAKRSRKKLTSKSSGGRRRSRSNRKRRRRNLSAKSQGQAAQFGFSSNQRNSVTENFFQGQQSAAAGHNQSPQGQSGLNNSRGVHHKANKWRGKVTFWSDLHTTYFQKLNSAKISGIFEGIRGQTESDIKKDQEFCQHLETLQEQGFEVEGNSFLNRHLNEFFSFYGFYQDVINDLQDNCNYEDDNEVAVLRAAGVIDQHLKLAKPMCKETQFGFMNRNTEDDNHVEEAAGSFGLLGYQIEPSRENENFSTDFFYNQIEGVSHPSKEIENQLEWLEKELSIVEKQVDTNVASLTEKIRVMQKTEERRENFMSSGANQKRLSEHFVQAVNYMAIMSIAESIERVKAVRQSPKLQPSQYNKKSCLQHVPFVLRRPYLNLIESQKSKNNLPFNGKEFLLAFDPIIGLYDFWADSALFFLFNLLRSDMARRQNYGRGLPIQLSAGYQAHPIININFDVDESLKTDLCGGAGTGSSSTTSKKRSQSGQMSNVTVIDEKSNIYSELELNELQLLQVKYGNETGALQFCHHCKQFKRKVIFAKCNFSSARHRMIYPNSTQVNGVKIYMAEGHNTKIVDCLTLKKLVKDKKRRRTLEEQLQVQCQQHFCSLCLKNFYDTCLEEVLMNPDWICPYCTGQCFCSRCRRLEQMTTAQAYLFSLNLPLLLYSPENVPKLFEAEQQRSSNQIDCYLRSNLQNILRTCDITQARQLRLAADPKLATLLQQARFQPSNNYFLDSSLSTSNLISQIQGKHVSNSTSSKTKKPKLSIQVNAEISTNSIQKDKQQQIAADTAEEKQIAKLRKRLHHEFRNMIADEWQFCRTSQANAAAQIHSVLVNGLSPADEQQSSHDEAMVCAGGKVSTQEKQHQHHPQSTAKTSLQQRRYKEDWEYLQQCGEAHKQLTAAATTTTTGLKFVRRATAAGKKTVDYNELSTKKVTTTAPQQPPHTARARPTKKLIKRTDTEEFRVPLSRRTLTAMNKNKATKAATATEVSQSSAAATGGSAARKPSPSQNQKNNNNRCGKSNLPPDQLSSSQQLQKHQQVGVGVVSVPPNTTSQINSCVESTTSTSQISKNTTTSAKKQNQRASSPVTKKATSKICRPNASSNTIYQLNSGNEAQQSSAAHPSSSTKK